jgi:HEAT repeat protein
MLGSDEAYSAVIEATRSPDARQRYLAAMALGAIGRADAQSALAPLFKDADPDVRLAAASAVLQLKGS